MSAQAVAFIGLGVMGKPMATNLRKAGFELLVHDRNRAAESDLLAQGARSADSPRQAAAQADVVICMVRDGQQTKEVMLGGAGVLGSLKEGGTVLLMSTIDHDAICTVAEAGAARGIAVLDAPVSGGELRAKSGTLTIMVGGERAAYERCQPVLAAMGSELF